jgi:hypothetical protein
VAVAFVSIRQLDGGSVAKSWILQQVHEYAIEVNTNAAQHFDAFRDGGSVLNQIPTSCCIQSQDGADVSYPTLQINPWKTFQRVDFLEKLGDVFVFVVGQLNCQAGLKKEWSVLSVPIMLQGGDVCDIILGFHFGTIQPLDGETLQ